MEKALRVNGAERVGPENVLKTVDSLQDKVFKSMDRQGWDAEKAGHNVRDSVRYAGTFNFDRYVESTKRCVDDLDSQGYRLQSLSNDWMNSSRPYKGINATFQREGQLPFEVQFHTDESWAAHLKTHDDYKIVGDSTGRYSMVERTQANDRLVDTYAQVPEPPDAHTILDVIWRER